MVLYGAAKTQSAAGREEKWVGTVSPGNTQDFWTPRCALTAQATQHRRYIAKYTREERDSERC
jgi:hypothetical protein